MQEHTATRDGQQDFRLRGEVLAEVNNKRVAGRESGRWYELTLYRTASGKYLLLRFLYHDEGMMVTVDSAAVYKTAGGVLRALTNKDGGLSDLDKELLELAAKSDRALAGLWAEVLE